MNSKLWIRKAISSCLMIAMLATYSMVALAGTGKASGELIVTGNNFNGDAPFALVNGEAARSGRTVFTASTISTPDNTTAVIDLGSTGAMEIAPNSSLSISFDSKTASLDLISGSLTVLRSAEAINVNAGGKSFTLTAGETATAQAGKTQQKDDDDDDDDNGAAWWVWAAIFGGAVVGVVIAATSDNNRIALGGGTVVVSPNR